MLVTVGSAIFAMNYYCDYFFSITTDTSLLPQVLYENTEEFKIIVNYACSAASMFMALFMLYICV
jgi:hypothetical protein